MSHTASPRKRKRQPVHQRIARDLESQIRRDLKIGAKLPSETALAADFGVSSLTVREAVAGLVQKGLVERRHGSGTYVADFNAHCHAGVLLNLDLGGAGASGFWLPLATQAKHLLETIGYRVRLYSGNEQANPLAAEVGWEDLAADVENDHLLGLLALGTPVSDELSVHLRNSNIPVVGECAGGIYRAVNDYQSMFGEALRRLRQDGCRRVAVLSWGLHPIEDWQALFTAAEMPYLAERIVQVSHPCDYGIGYTLTRRLLHELPEPPDGLVICDEMLLPGASFAILEAGLRVPESLRLVTHANESSQIFSPLPTTALVVSPRRCAEQLAGVLARLIRGEAVPAGAVLAPYRVEARPGGAHLPPNPNP